MNLKARDDWKLGDAPATKCGECGGTDIYPQAIDVGDGMLLFWGCDLCGSDGMEWDDCIIDWPYGDDDIATADDLRSLGFEIV